MANDLITVCMFGPAPNEPIKLQNFPDVEADGFEIHAFATDSDLTRILSEHRPQVLVSFGPSANFPQLLAASIEVRKRWTAIEEPNLPAGQVAERILATFVANAVAPGSNRFPQLPLVSVFTPTYKSGERILRPFHSLLDQSYANWEWVLYDDSPDDGATFARLQELASRDARLMAYRADRHCGIIGEVKRRACGLARGSILVELDHDDELTVDALASVVAAFQAFPDAGFAYTDCAEVFEHGDSAIYPEGWAFGFGSYRTEFYRGRPYFVSNYPSLNSKTVRHIVGMPNHIRAWTKAGYQACGGYSPEVHVADDYEICLRTFLTTRMIHIQRFGYIQYHDIGGTRNTQRVRNREIQRLVRQFQGHYEPRIRARFAELGVDDFICRDGNLDWNTPNPASVSSANYVFR